MENASKALIIAGGVLVSIIILGLLVLAWSGFSNFAQEKSDAELQEQISEFNKSLESYQKSLLRGTEVASVINKVRSNNQMYDDKISWQFELKDNIVLEVNGTRVTILSSGVYNEGNSNAYDNCTQDKSYFNEFKRLYFRCTGIEYSAKTGKINAISFQQIEKSQIQTWYNNNSI